MDAVHCDVVFKLDAVGEAVDSHVNQYALVFVFEGNEFPLVE